MLYVMCGPFFPMHTTLTYIRIHAAINRPPTRTVPPAAVVLPAALPPHARGARRALCQGTICVSVYDDGLRRCLSKLFLQMYDSFD